LHSVDALVRQSLIEFSWHSGLELGAGTGICCLFLALHAKPRFAVATDGSTAVVDLISRNVTLHKKADSVECGRTRCRAEDRTAVVERFGDFDYVIGSEIAYDESCVGPVVDTIGQLLNATGRFVTSHIDRYAKTTRALLAKLHNAGFVKEEEIEWDELVN
jgi:precorrin-6B methylase 2